MFAPANRTSAPRSCATICSCSFAKRSLRSRSKSTRYCQSAAVWLYSRRGSHSCGWPIKLVSSLEPFTEGDTCAGAFFVLVICSVFSMSLHDGVIARPAVQSCAGSNLLRLLFALSLQRLEDLFGGCGQRRYAYAHCVVNSVRDCRRGGNERRLAHALGAKRPGWVIAIHDVDFNFRRVE